MKPILDQALVNHMANRKQPWLKEKIPWWAIVALGAALAAALGLIVWGAFLAIA